MNKDFTNVLTVFLISCGNNPNYQDCVNALSHQTISFNLKYIKNVIPLSAAFQKMIDDCKTAYYIEIDEDMIMQPNAIEAMYNFMMDCEKRDNRIAMCSFKLDDVHTGVEIYGVKIYRHEILKKYPYNLHHPSCEVEQIARFREDGYINFLSNAKVGSHSPKWTDELIFDRYNNLMRKFMIYRYQWLERMPEALIKKIMGEPTRENIFALLGAYQGIIDGGLEKEKNLSIKNLSFMKFLAYSNNISRATLYMTSKCNFHCGFCVRQHGGIEDAPDMSVEIINEVIYKFPKLSAVCLCGFGEPLLCDNLIPILQRLKERHIFAGLITNGSMLKHRFLELREQSVGYISVSLNACNATEHQRITKTEAWGDVIDGIKLLVDYKKIELMVSYVLTKKSINEIKPVIDLMNELGVKSVQFHNILPHFDSNDDGTFDELVLTVDDEDEIKSYQKYDVNKIVKRWPVLLGKGDGVFSCRFPYETIQINGNGSLGLCNSVIPCDKKYGNIRNCVVWNSEVLSKFREDYTLGKISQCRKCFRNWMLY